MLTASKKILLFSLSTLFFSVLFLGLSAGKINAACTYQALCDAPPGECSTTCNGGQPCQINNGGTIQQCNKTCRCSNNLNLSCSVEGSLCGGSGSDPYNTSSNFGTCTCQDITPCELKPTCSETTWATCCSPGSPAPSGSPVAEYCGNGSCSAAAGEDCNTCESDCGSCPAGPSCGDGSCNGGENCGSCAADCGACTGGGGTFCGNNVCESGESCSTCSADCGSCLTCGDNSCNNGETCSTCATDCGACGASCGDGQCTGFETSESCPGDCGVSLFEGNQPWWQANGLTYSGSTTGVATKSDIFDGTCTAPSCIAQLLFPDTLGNADSEGIAITGGGTISVNGFLSTNDAQAIGSSPTRFKENYDYFYRNSGLGLNPTNDFDGQTDAIQEPVIAKEAYFHRGNVTLSTPWTVSSGESYVIFIDGDLLFFDPSNVDQLIEVEEGGFLAFIVSGDINIYYTFGNEDLTKTTPNLEGVFVADGKITVQTRGADYRFIGAGSFISWDEIVLERNYADGGSRDAENQDKPTEMFLFRPDLVKNAPAILTRPHTIWQETN